MPIYNLTLSSDSSDSTLELIEKRRINRILNSRYNMVSQVANDDTKVIGIVIGTLTVNHYMDLIKKLKEVITKSGKKAYEILVGKLNEPKLKNLAIVDLYVLVSCRETSLIDSREFMATVVTPHELLMALQPNRFPWQCKIITDFRVLLDEFDKPLTEEQQANEEEEEKTPEEVAEDLADQMQLVKVEHRDLVPIFTTQVLQRFDQMTFKGLDLQTQIDLQGQEVKKIIPGKIGIASMYQGENET